jgi:hypothetical protein
MKKEVRDVHISNETENAAGGGIFGELIRLHTEFHTRLAEETLKYLRRLQGTTMPAVPGTVLKPGGSSELKASGSAGKVVELKLEVENRQKVYCTLTPMLTPLVGASGAMWFPVAESSPPVSLIAPEEVASVVISLPLPSNLPNGAYRGAIMLLGFREAAIAVTVEVKGEVKGSAEGKPAAESKPAAEAKPAAESKPVGEAKPTPAPGTETGKTGGQGTKP